MLVSGGVKQLQNWLSLLLLLPMSWTNTFWCPTISATISVLTTLGIYPQAHRFSRVETNSGKIQLHKENRKCKSLDQHFDHVSVQIKADYKFTIWIYLDRLMAPVYLLSHDLPDFF